MFARELNNNNDKPEFYSAVPPTEWVEAILANVADAQYNRGRWTERCNEKRGEEEVAVT